MDGSRDLNKYSLTVAGVLVSLGIIYGDIGIHRCMCLRRLFTNG